MLSIERDSFKSKHANWIKSLEKIQIFDSVKFKVESI